MPEVEIQIGGRSFQVACQEGEEKFLQSAASLLDNEATALANTVGRLPETRMLLMAGLMLADKTAGLEEDLRQAQAANEASAPPKTIEVPVIPSDVTEAFSEIADRAEALVAEMEKTVSG